jgi:hypothetical protein
MADHTSKETPMLFRSIQTAWRSVRPTRRSGVRPRLESLEDRTVPSTFTVLNLADGGEGSLRQAVLAANTQPGADTILFADGLSGTIGLTTGQLIITDHLTIDGPGAGQLTVSGNHQSRIFNIGAGKSVAIDGLTIADGRAVGDGGGILNTGGTLSLAGVVLSGNQAVATLTSSNGRGGAIANLSGATLTVTDCLFNQNQVLGGSGAPGPLFVRSGAGILNLGSRLTVSHSTFLGNQSLGGTGGGRAQAGGIHNENGATATITDSSFIANQAIAGDGSGDIGFGRAGAFLNHAATLTLENCTILGNVAQGGSNNTSGLRVIGAAGGGAIHNSGGGTLLLTESTISGNRAIGGANNTSTGGDADVGTAFGGAINNVATAIVTNCLFADNEARGGNGNQGDGISFQFVGTGTGGAIATSARDNTRAHASLTLSNVKLRHNRAVGGDGNTAGKFVNTAIGGAVANNGSNPFLTPSEGSEVTLRDCTVAHNQAVGGRDGAALGGGIANLLGGVVMVTGSGLTHNRAQGGDGGEGSGGGIYNGAPSAHPSNPIAPTVLTVGGSAIAHNKAQGGAAGVDGRGGDGLGGGLWNGGTASVVDTAVSRNHAIGGEGADNGETGNGFGGGAYNQAAATLVLARSIVTDNHANGGVGVGGGVYNLGGFDFDEFTLISENHASTSHDEIFDPFA